MTSPTAPAHTATSPETPLDVGDDERRARAALTRIAEPGDEAVGRWLRRYGPVATLAMLTGQDELPGVSDRRAAGYRVRRARVRPEADLGVIRELGGRFVCPGDEEWPTQLDDLGDQRPIGLWVRGRPSLRMWALRSVALVGARACGAYGSHVAATLAADLAEAGWTVVSGAAYGIDAAAHRGALAAGGATAAVLACGVDVPYPAGHAELLRRVTQQGLVIAELAPGDHPTRSRFVLRNRVIAALTRGTLVVQAQLRSGSLVTARWARQLGRVVMGVPGPVTSALSAGVHELLRGEAQLVTDAPEVIELVGAIGEDLAPPRHGPVLPRDLLGPAAAAVLEALPGRRRTATAEQIARDAGIGLDETTGRLHELHALGFVERDGPNWRLTPPQPRRPSGDGGDNTRIR
ncbi:DNA-processing protein DprA [Streptomyces sp. ICBB 8177]|uniref:DNA-processing protein DprA n=1 Tax=Streptomyces sp. ICBB 8177 TaxID=563922 RepID=UPI000D67B344|nr:DNA-processing protein DprA [Streptomyces sp. ICBB 8177]PWI44312.1 DNA-protecting protein DprA [Streptomyces sp. ICBB 8177]